MTDAGESSTQALDWVKGELDETLKQATQSLEFFVENTDDDYELGNCADALQQVGGTLRIVDIPGAVVVRKPGLRRHPEAAVDGDPAPDRGQARAPPEMTGDVA